MNQSRTMVGSLGPDIVSQSGSLTTSNMLSSAASAASSPATLMNISEPALAAQLSSVLGSSHGLGFPVGFLLEAFLKLLGLEVSALMHFMPYVTVAMALYWLWTWVLPRGFKFCLRYFAASVELEGRDMLYQVLMAELRKQHNAKKSAALRKVPRQL